MDPFEFTALPEEFTPLSREAAEPPEEYPSPIPTEVSAQDARREKRRRLKKMLAFLSVAGVITLFTALPGQHAPAPEPEKLPPSGQTTQVTEPPAKGTEPGPPATVTEPVPVPDSEDAEIEIPYAMVAGTGQGRVLRFTYLVFLYNAEKAEAELTARDGSGAIVVYPETEIWDGRSRTFRSYSMDVSGLGEDVSLFVTIRYEAAGETREMTVSREAAHASADIDSYAAARLKLGEGSGELTFSGGLTHASDDPHPYRFEQAFFAVYWYSQKPDGSFEDRGAWMVPEMPECEEDDSGWYYAYSGTVGVSPPSDEITHYSVVLQVMDYDLMLSWELDSGIMPLERAPDWALGDRLLRITVVNNSGFDIDWDTGEIIPEILLQTEMNELEFTGLELPVPEEPEEYEPHSFTFVGFVLVAGEDGEEEPSYSVYVGLELTPEAVARAPVVTYTDPDTGETREMHDLVLFDMWLCNLEDHPYTVELDPNGGLFQTFTSAPGVVLYDDSMSFNVRSPLYSSTIAWTAFFPVPVRPGYTFTGWYRDPECSGRPVVILYGDDFYGLLEPEDPGGAPEIDWSVVVPVKLYAGWAPDA